MNIDELSRGQAQNGVNFDFEVKFDLGGQGQSPPPKKKKKQQTNKQTNKKYKNKKQQKKQQQKTKKTIGILTKVFYIYGPNLVILPETGHDLSRGQARDWRTDGHTDRRRQRQYPKAKIGIG